jgi:hydroxymethylglutaryl-CoA synthase
MRPSREVGIVGYGAYVPRFRITAQEIARVWRGGLDSLPIKEKAVPGLDEDSVTMAIEASRNALFRAEIDAKDLRAIWVGTESKPYAVKPSGTLVAEALNTTPSVLSADLEFACKAGTEALQAAIALVGSAMADHALAVGVDTAQGKPGDELEYTTGAGGAAFIVGPRQRSLAYLEGSYSYVTDTPDFFRRPQEPFPAHGNRFTGEPSYFTHVLGAASRLMESLNYGPSDFAHVIFHQPNDKFPRQAAKRLGFKAQQVEGGMLVAGIGNTYAGSSMLGMTAVLDNAAPGDRILLVSYGSGAGSDAFSWVVTDRIRDAAGRAPTTREYVARREEIDYGTYVRFRGKLKGY